ncbi:MAG: hypothetical protein KBF89_03825 [Acidimicrobiia bacterium]|nr:hypothetical protein [Acidimicrobiia bacterium]
MKKSTKYITGQYGITETRIGWAYKDMPIDDLISKVVDVDAHIDPIVDQLGAGEAQRVDSQRLGDLQQGKDMPKLAG